MPTDSTKQPQQILTLPPGASGDQLLSLVNDRINQINLAFAKFLQNPALGSADLGQAKIINLADPKDDLDGVNLRTLKRFGGTGTTEQVAGGSANGFPTIYFTFDGAPDSGEISPYAIILPNRAGFTPVEVGVSAVGAPVSDALAVNLTIGGVSMLSSDLLLAIGDSGPAVSTSFALAGALAVGTLIQAVIVSVGGATQVTIALSIRGQQ